MPKLGSENIQTNSGFSFSGESIQNLDGNDRYTLACVTIDCSSSTFNFTDSMKQCIEYVIEACKDNKIKNNVLLRIAKFNSYGIEELIGYTQPEKIVVSDILSHIYSGGSTPLFDATVESVESASAYAKKLANSYYTSNSVVFIITDGEENTSQIVKTGDGVHNKLDKVKKEESLESIKMILIGLCDGSDINNYLQSYKDQVGIDDYVNANVADAKTFKKLGNFISQSISSTNQALGSGAPSQSLTF